MTVLVVDDNDAVRYSLKRLLANLGCNAIAAASGQEAVRLCAEHREQISCVLLDMTMPVMNGVETFRVLKQQTPALPVILCSGHGEQEVIRHFTDKTPEAFLQKPYRQHDLRAALDRVLS